MSFESSTPIDLVTDGTPVTYGVVQPGLEDENGVLFIRGGDISSGRINIASLRTISSELSHQYKRTLLRGRELLISLVGNPGEVAVVPVELAGSNIARQVGLIRVDENRFNPWFVQYYLMSPAGKDQLFSYSLGSVQSVINLKELKRVEIPNTPIEIQNSIVKSLKDIDGKIDLNHRINQTLEVLAQALFKSWFVDFDPVKAKIAAKAEGRDPLRAAMSAISGKSDTELDALPTEHYEQLATTAALFPDEMEASVLGAIPRGWEVQRVGKVLELVYGKALKSTDRNVGAVPVYGSGGITGYHNIPLVAHGSIIVGRKGTVGSLYWEDEPFFPIDTTYYVRPLTAPLTFCYYALQTFGLEKMNTDAAVPGLNRENVYRIEMLLPGSCVLLRFDSQVSALRKAIRANVESSRSLADLRDTLLPKLLSGELSVDALVGHAGAA